MSCLACDLTSGAVALPGGTLHRGRGWLVEHCVGPWGLGTLVVKPGRHVVAMADLTDAEAAELGPLLRLAARVAGQVVEAEQVYVCLWSHADAVPGHIHYVVQPVTGEQVAAAGLHGPALQMHMFRQGHTPAADDVERIAPEITRLFTRLAGGRTGGG